MFETAMFGELFEKLCQAAHKNSKEKGFWDGTKNPDNVSIPCKILLIISEGVEMFESYRKGTLHEPCDKDITILDPTSLHPCTYKCEMCNGRRTVKCVSTTTFQPCPSCAGTGTHTAVGIRRLTNEEEELADLVIRIADYSGRFGIDLGGAVLAKMRYNATRPHMHGKTC